MTFDEITRNSKILMEGETEENFLKFCSYQETCRRKWEAAEMEVVKLREEISKSEGNLKKLEMQLGQARELLSAETTCRRRAETERDQLNEKFSLVFELITSGGGPEGQTLNDETKLKLQTLEASLFSRRGTAVFSPGQGGVVLSPVNEIDGTGSILDVSELSFDNTQGSVVGLDESKLRNGKQFKRKSSGGVAQVVRQQKRRKSSGQTLEAVAARKSSDALRIAAYNERNIDDCIASAPPMEYKGLEPSASSVTLTPSHGSTTTLLPATPYTPGRLGKVGSTARMVRDHKFIQKNCYKTENCGPCGKRIKFSKVCYKCSECRAVAHPECRTSVPMPCVPVGSAQKTPGGRGGHGHRVLADLVPLCTPMVPAVLVHTVNEIEARGLEETGLYRVPGAESQVRQLGDKFNQGKGCPNLSQVDVHVLCGTIKDFFRSLKEPLIPTSMWAQFNQAANSPDMTDGEVQLYQAVSELPQPNRDTLAFFMVHLQKVATSTAARMNVSNLGKILGPTIVGYHSLDPKPEDILKEVGLIQCTMERLLNIDGGYWATFLSTTEGKNLFDDNKFMSPFTPEPSIFRTPYFDDSTTPNLLQAGSAINRKNLEHGRIFASPVME